MESYGELCEALKKLFVARSRCSPDILEHLVSREKLFFIEQTNSFYQAVIVHATFSHDGQNRNPPSDAADQISSFEALGLISNFH
jgi:hypothetical protein